MKTVKLPTGFVCPWQLAGLPADTPVAVAFSGGADSVALLHMLKAVAKAPITARKYHNLSTLLSNLFIFILLFLLFNEFIFSVKDNGLFLSAFVSGVFSDAVQGLLFVGCVAL